MFDGAYGVTVALQLVELAVPGQVRIGTPGRNFTKSSG